MWDGVNETISARHVHGVAVDHSTGYVYATVGDGGSWTSPITIRSTDQGGTWARILKSMPQCVGVDAQATFRLFGTDQLGSRGAIYRTTDDATLAEVLTANVNLACLWIRTDPDTGYVYAGFGGSTIASGSAGVWRSTDSGLTWELVLALPITAAADGTSYASNIVGGRLILSVVSGGINIGGGVYAL